MARQRSWMTNVIMKLESCSPRQNPLFYISIFVNILLSYYILSLKVESDILPSLLPAGRSTCPECPCAPGDSNGEFKPGLNHHMDGFNVEQMKIPENIPEDSSDHFVIDMGTYEPEVNNMLVTKVTKKPVCDPGTKLVFGIKSIAPNHDRREVVRKTWGSATNFEDYPAKIVFLLGIQEDKNRKSKAVGSFSLKRKSPKLNEVEDADDLLIGDFHDSFHNLTYKDSMLVNWVKHDCPSAEYIFKGDDDTLVNPFELKKLIDTDLERQSKLEKKEASIYGSLLETQPVERHSTKYGDNLWPSKDYPTYVSGGGFLMNRMASDAIQFYIKITPKINIDDAFIGVLMKRAKMGNNLFRDTRFHSWGFKPYYEKQFDVCEIDKVIYFHKFLPKELNCFWPKFLENRKFCSDPDYKYKEDGDLCNRNLWYKSKNLSTPNLDGPNYHRCGPDFENAVCSVNSKDWSIRQPHNGPCCSPGGYCGTTPQHCSCSPGCVDFQTMVKKTELEKNNNLGKCCKYLKVDSGLTYAGTYELNTESSGEAQKEGGFVSYHQKTKDSKKGFTIKYGGFSVHGTGWYILAEAGGGLAWQLTDSTSCPPLGDWQGYGAVFSCTEK